MNRELQFDESAPCSNCGRFGAYLFDGRSLCGDCYEKCGSCCPEFGADDLWRANEDAAVKPVKSARVVPKPLP
jgi:hypothetical protein